MDTSQDHGAALHGSSSCQVRCCTVQRPQCALLSAADHPRRTGVERSTSSTSSFIASTGTAAACRRPPAQLRRRADATADHMGPVAVQADLVVPPVSFVGPGVCGYGALFFHFIDEYSGYPATTVLHAKRLTVRSVCVCVCAYSLGLWSCGGAGLSGCCAARGLRLRERSRPGNGWGMRAEGRSVRTQRVAP